MKELFKDFWFVPLLWPLLVIFEVGSKIEAWSLAVLWVAFGVACMVPATMLMVPVQVGVFASIFIAAVVMAPVHLYRACRK